VEFGPGLGGRPRYEVWHRADGLVARAGADGWTVGLEERWFDPAEPDDTAPSAWADVIDSSITAVALRPVGEPRHRPAGTVVQLHSGTRARSVAAAVVDVPRR